jgi:hypothetical protein
LRVPPSLDFQSVEPTKRSLSSFVAMLQKIYRTLAFVVNGHISLGNGSSADNVDGVWVNVTTSTTQFSVTHNLGRIPAGFLVANKSASVDIYQGTTAWTNTTMSLVGTVSGVSALLFVF